MSETTKTLNKISFLVAHTGSSQLSFFLINELNKMAETNPEIDAIIYHENKHRNCVPANFAVMNLSDAWANNGPVIATSLSTAKKMISFPSDRKLFYVWDIEWIRNNHMKTLEYEEYSEVYTDNSLELIARSEPHKRIIENAFNKPVSHIVSDFNMSEILEILK
jgi:hypothetical protein